MNSVEAKVFVDEFYKKVAARWKERVTNCAFMEKLRGGTLPRGALRLFFKNWGAYTIEINTARYSDLNLTNKATKEGLQALEEVRHAAEFAHSNKMQVLAGHGLNAP